MLLKKFTPTGLLALICIFSACTLYSQNYCDSTPVAVHGNLAVNGTKIVDQRGNIVSLAGNSFFWSNNGFGGEKFYNEQVVEWLKNDWKSTIVRAAMGVEDPGGYINDPQSNKQRVKTIVDAAIDKGLYVIIDWHSHHAEDYEEEAIDFFKEMANLYGEYPNVLYEIYNEPLRFTSWNNTVKPYSEAVISEIRAIDPDNIILVGSPVWSQAVDVASENPITISDNLAYTLHFYAATHFQNNRDRAQRAIDNGLPLFVTEWGASSATHERDINEQSTDEWIAFLKANDISQVAWAVNDKDEFISAMKPGANRYGGWGENDLTPTGLKTREINRGWQQYCETEQQQITLTNPSDNSFYFENNTVSIAATIFGFDGANAEVAFFVDDNSVGTDNTSPYSFDWTATAGEHTLFAQAKDATGAVLQTSTTISITVSSSPAYPDGEPHTLPGSIRSVDYDLGGEGNAYHDTAPDNRGTGPRQDEGVDTGGTGESATIGWTANGEWLNFTVDVQQAGTYNVTAMVGTPRTAEPNFSLRKDGQTIANFTAPFTGGWDNYQGVSDVVTLEEGIQTLTVFLDQGGFNFQEISFELSDGTPQNIAPTVEITGLENNDTFLLGDEINIVANAQDIDGQITEVTLFVNDVENASTDQESYQFTIQPTVGNYEIYVLATDDDGLSTSSDILNITVVNESTESPESSAYPDGEPHAIPGSIRSVDYDLGGEGNAYHDTAPGNNGNGPRQDENVDTGGAGETATIGWTANGEWLNFTVDVQQAGTYNVTAMVGTPRTAEPNFSLRKDGQTIANFTVPHTGAWSNYQGVSDVVTLEEGVQTLTVFLEQGGFNFQGISFELNDGSTPSPNIAPTIEVTGIENNDNFIVGEEINIVANAQDTDGQITEVTLFVNGVENASTDQESYQFTIQPTVGSYDIYVVATDDDGLSTSSDILNITVVNESTESPESSAYPDGEPHAIPGSIRSVDYDLGGEGNAYHDTAPDNRGTGPRQDEGVDTGGTGESATIGWTANGEWLNFTVDVQQAGTYNVTAMVGTPRTAEPNFSLRKDGQTIANFTAPFTGGWDNYQGVSDFVTLEEGVQTLTVFLEQGGFNFQGISFELNDGSTPNPNIAPTVEITGLSNEVEYPSGTSIPITIAAFDTDGTIVNSILYINEEPVISSTEPSFVYNWVPEAGTYTVHAETEDNDLALANSTTATINVVTEANTDTCGFANPQADRLQTIGSKSYSNIHIIGDGGPDFSAIIRFTINWDLENNGLYELNMNSNNGVPSWWINFLPKVEQGLAQDNPYLTFSNTAIPNFDGRYNVNYIDGNFVLISADRDFVIYFSNSDVAPNCDLESTALTISTNFGVETNLDDAINLFPNPTTNYITLAISEADEFTVATIYNLSGQLIRSQNIVGLETVFDTSQLIRGTYIIRVHGAHGSISKTFIKK